MWWNQYLKIIRIAIWFTANVIWSSFTRKAFIPMIFSYHYTQIKPIDSFGKIIPYDVLKYCHQWFRQWLVACSTCHSTPHYFIEAEWHIYASVNQTMINADNGFSPVLLCGQWIIWTLVYCKFDHLEKKNQMSVTTYQKYQNTTMFIQENSFENVVRKMPSILSLCQGIAEKQLMKYRQYGMLPHGL